MLSSTSWTIKPLSILNNSWTRTIANCNSKNPTTTASMPRSSDPNVQGCFHRTVLVTPDSNFPLQLWDKLTPQVMNTLNMTRASYVNPAISAYEALNGLYNWNWYPLALLGRKALIYEDGDTRVSWASRRVDGWYLVLCWTIIVVFCITCQRHVHTTSWGPPSCFPSIVSFQR